MARPLAWTGSALKEMSDAELDRLVYYLQVAYAAQLNADGDGRVWVASSGGTSIGSASDTSRTQQINSRAAPADNIIQTYPAYPGMGTETDTTYNYRQDQTFPSLPSGATQDSSGYFYWSGSTIRVTNTEAHLYDQILAQAIAGIRNGDYVGSYYVSTAEPTIGGAGTWVDKGTFFDDTRYGGSNALYKLWLKTGLTTVPGSNVYPLGSASGNLRQRPITNSDPLIQDVLLPALTYQISNASSRLKYLVNSTNDGFNHGVFTDTRYDQVTNDQYFTGSGASEVYYSRSTPNTSGTSATITTYYFKMDGT